MHPSSCQWRCSFVVISKEPMSQWKFEIIHISQFLSRSLTMDEYYDDGLYTIATPCTITSPLFERREHKTVERSECWHCGSAPRHQTNDHPSMDSIFRRSGFIHISHFIYPGLTLRYRTAVATLHRADNHPVRDCNYKLQQQHHDRSVPPMSPASRDPRCLEADMSC